MFCELLKPLHNIMRRTALFLLLAGLLVNGQGEHINNTQQFIDVILITWNFLFSTFKTHRATLGKWLWWGSKFCLPAGTVNILHKKVNKESIRKWNVKALYYNLYIVYISFNVPISNETKVNIITITRTECGNLAARTPLMPAQNVSGLLTWTTSTRNSPTSAHQTTSFRD